jgi:ABC-type sugar transport system substrate-binding protein
MEAFLQTGKKVDLVVTHWNAAAAAAAMALDEAGYTGDVSIVGLEFNKELVTYIKEGKVDAVTFYSVEDLGYTVVENTANFLNGQTIPKFVEIETIVVDINNVDDIEPEF